MSCILSPVSAEFYSPSAGRLTLTRKISGLEPRFLQDYGTEVFSGMAGSGAGNGTTTAQLLAVAPCKAGVTGWPGLLTRAAG
jgi:hypothetical protein